MASVGSAGRGGISRALAGLLALVLLVLAASPAAARATAAEPHGRPAAHGHPAPGHGRHEAGAASAHPEGDQPAGQHHGGDAGHALACCLAMHCPMMTGGLPDAAQQPGPPPGRAAPAPVAPRQPAGLSIPPSLPPPRAG